MSPDTAAAPVRVIQVGAGGMGRVWLELLTASPDVELVGLVDLNLDLAQQALVEAGAGEVLVAKSVSEIVAKAPADAVINVTVPVAHHPVTTEALFAGLHVLSEKPIAPTVQQALSLAAASERSERLLMTSQSRRYYATLAQFREEVRTLGEVGTITTEFSLAPRFGGFRDEMPHPLLVDMAIHQFDAARYLLDSDPVSVYCESSNPQWSWYDGDAMATALFEFDGGARYIYNGSWCSEGFETSWNGSWRVSGARGTVLWDGETAPQVDLAEVEDAQVDAAAGSADSVPETIAGALAEFIDAVRTGRVPSGEVHSNVISLAMVEAAVLSAESGQRVSIGDVLEDAYVAAVNAERHPEVRTQLEGWGSAQAGLTR